MKRCLTLFSALFLLHISNISAQHKHTVPPIQSMGIASGIKPAQLQTKFRQLIQAIYATPGANLKVTAGSERLVALADYDLTLPPNTRLQDSLIFSYSAGRSSSFDFNNLTYDYFNNSDVPSPFPSESFVHFDTFHLYLPPGPSPSVFGTRSYGPGGKVSRDENPYIISTYNYDVANRLIRSSVIEYDPLTASWDSSYRDFYSYDANGHLILDSSESWDSTLAAYIPSGNLIYTNNAAGYPIQVSLDFIVGPGTITAIQIDFTYGVPANKPSRAILKFYDGTSLQNGFKDTLGYSGGMMNYYNSYDWDTTTKAWILVYEERRNLNAAFLPDSVWFRSFSASLPIDSARFKLAYNAEDNPVYVRMYNVNNTVPNLESRYYYGPIESVGVAPAAVRKDLSIYPNPAIDKLYLKDVQNGLYAIYNASGQLAQTGTLEPGSVISVHALTPGIYSINLRDKVGAVYTTQFIRQ